MLKCCTIVRPASGVVLFRNHDNNLADILRWADAAMYQAKDAGRNAICFSQGQT